MQGTRGHAREARRRGAEEASERFAHTITVFTGSTSAFAIALGVVIAWVALGPLFHYSDAWQLVINTGTTIVTFLMVFLIQRMQNKESLAIHLKLNELVAAVEGSSNRLLNIEDLTEEELETFHRYYKELARLAKKGGDVLASHSIEEAARRQRIRASNATKLSKVPKPMQR